MKFRNDGKEGILVRFRNETDPWPFDWKTVEPGDEIDIPENQGRALKLIVVDELGEGKKEIKPKVGKYVRRLVELKGVGEKTIKDIVKEYPSEVKLIKAIKDKDHLSFRDDVVKKLIKEFGD